MFNFKIKGTVEAQVEDLVKDIISKKIDWKRYLSIFNWWFRYLGKKIKWFYKQYEGKNINDKN